MNKTFKECKADPRGTVYEDWEEGELRCQILRGPVALCAYIGVKEGHSLYGKDYSDDDMPDISCHGGLTYSGKGDGKYHPEGYWWFGWDYAHSGDAVFYEWSSSDFEWTPDLIRAEFPEAIAGFPK